MDKCRAEIFLPRHNFPSPLSMAETVLDDDLVPRSMSTSWNGFGCQSTPFSDANISTRKSTFDMTFPLMEVDELMVDAILQSINNPGNHFIPVIGTHSEEEREEAGASDDTLSDMSELTSLSELDREAESVIDGTAFAIPLHSQYELFRCGYKGCTTHIANNRCAIESHLRQAHPTILPPKNERIARTTHCRWPRCDSKHLINTDNIWRHIAEIHWGSLAHRCAICRKGFSRKDSCSRHIRQKHTEELLAASRSC